LNAGIGTWKPKLVTESVRPLIVMSPKLRPTAVEPQAIRVPAAIATRPAGTPP
jgi:hypothetical protein